MSNVADNFEMSASSGEPIDELLLTRYLDGRLEGAQRRDVEELLRTNSVARRRLDVLREEERLIRDSLEELSEPSRRLSDKVIATLHNEERFRLQAARNRRLRRNVLWGATVAASFLLCIYVMKPRASMGSALSGTGATLVVASGERRPLTKNTNLYERDQVITAQGRFERLVIGASVVDLDERSRLSLEKSSPVVLSLENGRAGIRGGGEIQIQAGGRTIRVAENALVDLWLPRPVKAEWPAWLLTNPFANAAASVSQNTSSVVVTVLSGSATLTDVNGAETVTLSAPTRTLLGIGMARQTSAINVAESRVLETRSGTNWHTTDGAAPQDRTLLGLFDAPNFADLGQRLGLYRNAPAGLIDSLNVLQAAQRAPSADVRIEKLAEGQQALRLACENFKADDERREFGRLLEGLAHLERGRALARQAKSADAARVAFDAARVAFEESAKPSEQDLASRDWSRQLAAGPGVTLRDLSAANQAALLAAFNHAAAQLWLARSDEDRRKEALLLAGKEFAALQLGRSVEALAARLALGLAQAEAGLHEKAAEAFSDVLAAQMAGWSDTTRPFGEGLRQAALVELTRLFARTNQPEKARAAAEDFALLYPLGGRLDAETR